MTSGLDFHRQNRVVIEIRDLVVRLSSSTLHLAYGREHDWIIINRHLFNQVVFLQHLTAYIMPGVEDCNTIPR